VSVSIIDSHTEGEPTRVILDGWPALEGATMAERARDVAQRFDHLRRAIVSEPRGNSVAVGAIITPPVERGSACGVVFFNDAGLLGMCGHGTIGLVRTLAHLGRIHDRRVRIDTPVGTVEATMGEDGSVVIENVPARVHALDVRVHVPEAGWVAGDVAWGGNWFFLTHGADALTLSHAGQLTRRATAIRDALREAGIHGAGGAIIDHIELVGPPARPDADGRNFVLCPGVAYDRSPCGTGTSATMAVRHARGQLAIGARWRQEGITGTVFTGWLVQRGDDIVPFIQGHAWITGETVLRFAPDDPFRWGIPAVAA
jgi:proline racemase